MISTKPNTIAVVWIVSFRVGQTTFFVSATDSRPNAKKRFPGSDVAAMPAPTIRPASTTAIRSTNGCCDSR